MNSQQPTYELSEYSRRAANGVLLHRVRALTSIRSSVRAGDLGGWLEGATTPDGRPRLSGEAWVADNAMLLGDAVLTGRALIADEAIVSGRAEIGERAVVSGASAVGDDVQISGDARIRDQAHIGEWATVHGTATVEGRARISGSCQICGDATVGDDARVGGACWVRGDARVGGFAAVGGDARIAGDARLFADAEVLEEDQMAVVGPIGSENVVATLYRTRSGRCWVDLECWRADLDSLWPEVEKRRLVWHRGPQKHEMWLQQYRALIAFGSALQSGWSA
ncbi:LbetaH domain-containing protein [Subtercola endophyticus]|uniref:hypothetical protein n=1 Tax=Subtercola endophyticus TaxID=2895559 RepID=UPI001E40058A|nr:hypothetical protein [Subtercola endophyticus]UFS59771.1 hypothetical protein LQ955_02965 [Subtercola endophyticus]